MVLFSSGLISGTVFFSSGLNSGNLLMLYFTNTVMLDISCESSARQCQVLFSVKIRKPILECRPLQFCLALEAFSLYHTFKV